MTMLEYYTPLKKGFILQSKGVHFEFRYRKQCREITFHFLAALRVAQHGLYTSNLLPMPMIEMAPPIFVGTLSTVSCLAYQFLPVYVTVHITTCLLVESAMCRICCEDRTVTCWHRLTMYATLKRKLHHKCAKQCPAFLFECFYDQQTHVFA